MLNFKLKELTNSFQSEEESFKFLKKNQIPVENFVKDSLEEKLIEPNFNDLARLLKICQNFKPINILEYGCGFSSYVFHHYLTKDYPSKISKKKHLQIIEVHNKYLNLTVNRFKKNDSNIEIILEECRVVRDKYRDDGSHFYLANYNFIPDVIYLDGPDPNDIEKSFFSRLNQRVPISSDILKIESWLMPGTVLIVDGRNANVRYLKRSFTRNWDWDTNLTNDCSIAILNEQPYGKKDFENLKERGLIK